MAYEVNQVIKEVNNEVISLAQSHLIDRLLSLYLVGSFATKSISYARPDINYRLVFKGNVAADDFLIVGRVFQLVEDAFMDRATIRIEFRPFRYIKPRDIHDFEVSLNPIITSEQQINAEQVIFNKWRTQGFIHNHQLIFG